jgi:hypothetical protein
MLRVTGMTATSLAGDERGTAWADLVDRLSLDPELRRRYVRLLGELEARPPRVFASRARERRDPVTLENELSHLFARSSRVSRAFGR